MKNFFEIGNSDQCHACKLKDEMFSKLQEQDENEKAGRPVTRFFILPLEVGKDETIFLCGEHETELDMLARRDGPNHWQPWNYIAGFAVSANY